MLIRKLSKFKIICSTFLPKPRRGEICIEKKPPPNSLVPAFLFTFRSYGAIGLRRHLRSIHISPLRGLRQKIF